MTSPVTPRRRAAPAPRSRPGGGVLAGAALVAVCTALLGTAGALESDPVTGSSAEVVPVERVATTCLGSPDAGDAEVSTVAVPVPDAPRGGRLTVAEVDAETAEGAPGDPGDPVEGARAARGRTAQVKAPGRGSARTVTAEDGQAVGRATVQVHRAEGTIAAQECLAPRTRWWFTGGGAGLDHGSDLVLANVDPGRAVVDLMLLGPDGEATAPAARGITMEPGEVRTFDAVDLAPQTEELAVGVETSRGRVVAALSDSFAEGPQEATGREWIPAQETPSRVVRLAPLPRRADRRTLLVANPADREALVEVEVSGASGAFAPTDAASLRVPPGSVASVDLTDAVGRDVSAVVLRSPLPVTGTVRTSRDGDVSYAAAAPALTGRSAALVPPGTSGAVHVTAATDGGAVELVAYDTGGKQVGRTELELEPGATADWSPKPRTAYVVATPSRGRLFGGVVLTDDGAIAQVPLRPVPLTLQRPAVEPVVR